MKDSKNTAQTATDVYTVLPTVPFLNEVVCSDWETAVKQLPNHCIDLVVTDPPYGMKFQSNRRQELHKSIQNDDNLDWLVGWVKELKRLCKPQAHLYVFCSWHNIDIFKRELGALFNIKNILIWKKNNHGSGDLLGDYAPQYEMCIFCSSGEKKLNGGRDSNILECRKVPTDNHPTEKPVNLIAYLIEKSSEKGEIVLDTFAGSYSTARAAVETGRNFICFEIDADYCTTARQLLFGTAPRLF